MKGSLASCVARDVECDYRLRRSARLGGTYGHFHLGVCIAGNGCGTAEGTGEVSFVFFFSSACR